MYNENYYFTTITENGKTRYFVAFPTSPKRKELIETKETIYWLLKSFQREDWRQERETKRHLEQLSLSEQELLDRAPTYFVASPEEMLYRSYFTENLRRAFEQIPSIQARRFLLHYGLDMSIQQIAIAEQCGDRRIRHSVGLAKKNLKEILKKESQNAPYLSK